MSSSVQLQLYTTVNHQHFALNQDCASKVYLPILSTRYTLVHIPKCSQGIQTGFIANEIKQDMPQRFGAFGPWD